LHRDWYRQAGIEVSPEKLKIGRFTFIHDITAETKTGEADLVAKSSPGAVGAAPVEEFPYAFSGHIHPGIRIRGMGKQSLQLPCFYFGAGYAVLPAFSLFTGTVAVDPSPVSTVFAILPANRHRGEFGGILPMQ
jgi:uncharacterized protein